MDKIQKILEEFGLSENEAKVYREAVKKETTSPFELSKLTGIPRTTVYDVVLSLTLKGLMEMQQSDGFTKQQTKLKAKNPSVLREIIRQKHKKLNALEVNIVDILPELKVDFHGHEESTDFQFMAGIEGAKKAYFGEKYLKMNSPRIVIDGLMPMDSFGKEEVNFDVDAESDETFRPVIRELVPLNDWTKHVISYQYHRNPKYVERREYRYIDNPIFEMYNRVTVIENKVLISCANNSEAWGVQISSASLAKSITSIFNLLWEFANPLTKDIISSWGMNEFLKAEQNMGKTQNG